MSELSRSLTRLEIENKTQTKITCRERIEKKFVAPVALREAVIKEITMYYTAKDGDESFPVGISFDNHTLDLTLSQDLEYPGLIIDILDKNGNRAKTIRIEQPVGESQLRALVYESAYDDDYTREILL